MSCTSKPRSHTTYCFWKMGKWVSKTLHLVPWCKSYSVKFNLYNTMQKILPMSSHSTTSSSLSLSPSLPPSSRSQSVLVNLEGDSSQQWSSVWDQDHFGQCWCHSEEARGKQCLHHCQAHCQRWWDSPGWLLLFIRTPFILLYNTITQISVLLWLPRLNCIIGD